MPVKHEIANDYISWYRNDWLHRWLELQFYRCRTGMHSVVTDEI